MEYSYVKKMYYESVYDIRNIWENINLIALSAISFFLPFVLGHPQILVGIIVNAMLIIGATYLKGHKLLPVILLPSFGVLSAGILFGTYTVFLLYLIPFIWIGNSIYAYMYKYIHSSQKNFKSSILSIGLASFLKAGFLFGVTFVLVSLTIVPPVFLIAMGLLQLTTALIGGYVALGIVSAKEKWTSA